MTPGPKAPVGPAPPRPAPALPQPGTQGSFLSSLLPSCCSCVPRVWAQERKERSPKEVGGPLPQGGVGGQGEMGGAEREAKREEGLGAT